MDTDKNKKWYVVHTYSGYENKVKTTLELKVQSMGMEDVISRILVPTEDIIDYDKKGNEKITKRKIYHGYVFVEMEVNDRSWYVVRNTPGVTGFVGSATKPVPLSDSEVEGLLRTQGLGPKEKTYNIHIGEAYEITEDSYRQGLVGIATVINADKGTVILSIDSANSKLEAEVGIADVRPHKEV